VGCEYQQQVKVAAAFGSQHGRASADAAIAAKGCSSNSFIS